MLHTKRGQSKVGLQQHLHSRHCTCWCPRWRRTSCRGHPSLCSGHGRCRGVRTQDPWHAAAQSKIDTASQGVFAGSPWPLEPPATLLHEIPACSVVGTLAHTVLGVVTDVHCRGVSADKAQATTVSSAAAPFPKSSSGSFTTTGAELMLEPTFTFQSAIPNCAWRTRATLPPRSALQLLIGQLGVRGSGVVPER